MRVGILGRGALGQALARLIRDAGGDCLISSERGREYGLTPAELSAEARLVFIATAPWSLRERVLAAGFGPQHQLVCATRGLDPSTGELPCTMLRRLSSSRRIGALGGPLVAGDLQLGRGGAAVVASDFEELREAVTLALASPRFRVYPSQDVLGLEWSGALVQIASVALGLCEGLGLGAGMTGVVFARVLAESRALLSAVGADPETLSGLAGAGALSAALSPHHPGFAAGLRLAHGEDLRWEEVLVSGDAACQAARALGLELPITRGVLAAARHEAPLSEILSGLMGRPLPGAE